MFLDLPYLLVFIYISGEVMSEFPPFAHVKYEQGTIVGLRREIGGNRRPFYTFKGIPYALPPVGDQRLKPPIGDAKWDGLRDGSWDPPVCAQFVDSEFVGEEDCLYLNVYTPKPGDFGYPVIVFIHGGDFINGGAWEYPPLPLLSHDVVLVVIQYRLGMLGFLSADDVELPGNLGLRDQTKALVWVKNYIREFGGDPNKVTLLGTGSGAASVHYQILTPYAKGLFSRAIMQSGSSLCPTMLRNRHSFTVTELLSKFNCHSPKMGGQSYTPSSVVLDCLKNLPLKELASLYRDYFEWHMLPLLTVPRVDGDYLPDHPIVLLKEGRYNKVDIIAGFNQHDGTIISANLYHYPYLMKLFRNKFLSVGALLMAFNEEEAAAQLTGIAYHKFIGANNISEPEGAEALTKLFTDRLFSVPIHDMLSLHAKTSPQNSLFYYRLVHRGKFSFCSFFSIPHGNNWVCNGDDLIYLFDYEGSFSDDLHLQNIIVTLWTNFVVYGNPTPDELLGFHWDMYNSESRQFLEIRPSPKMSMDNDTQSLHLWHTLATGMNKYLFSNGSGISILDNEAEIDYEAQYPMHSTDFEDQSKSEEAYLTSIVVPSRNLNKPIVSTPLANALPVSDTSYDIVIEDLTAASGMWSNTVYPNADKHGEILSEMVNAVEGIYEDPLQESPLQTFIHKSGNAEYACDKAMEAHSGLQELEDHHSIKMPASCGNHELSKGPSDEESFKKSEDGFCERAPKLQTVEDDRELQTKQKVSGLQSDGKVATFVTDVIKTTKLQTDEKAPVLQKDDDGKASTLVTDVIKTTKLQTDEKAPVLQKDDDGKASTLVTDVIKTTKLQTEEKAPVLQKDDDGKASTLVTDVIKTTKLQTDERAPVLQKDDDGKASTLVTDVMKTTKLQTDEKAPVLQKDDDGKASTLVTDVIKTTKLQKDEKAPVLQKDENAPKLHIAEKATKLKMDKKASDLLMDGKNHKLGTSDRPGVDASTMKPLEIPADTKPFDGSSVKKCIEDECEIEPQTLNSNKIPDYHTINSEPKKLFHVDNGKLISDMNLDPAGVMGSAEDVNVVFSSTNMTAEVLEKDEVDLYTTNMNAKILEKDEVDLYTTNMNADILDKDEVDLYTMISAGLMKAQVLLKGAGEEDVENVLSFVDKYNLQEIIATYGDYVSQYLKDIKVSPEQLQQIKREQSKVLVKHSTVLVQEEEERQSLLSTPEVTPDELYPNKKKINYGKINFSSIKHEVEVPSLVSSEGEGKI